MPGARARRCLRSLTACFAVYTAGTRPFKPSRSFHAGQRRDPSPIAALLGERSFREWREPRLHIRPSRCDRAGPDTAGSIALPAKELDDFVSAGSPVGIAQFPAAGLVALKGRVNAIALAPVEDFRRDSDLFGEASRNAEAQSRFQTAFNGFQTRDEEMDLGRLVGELSHP